MYKPKEFAKKIGVSVSTLRRWDKEKRLVPLRTQTNHRVYTDDDIFKVLNLKKPSNQGKIVVYCRVSSHAQKDDLQSQIEAMQTFCLAQGIAVDEWHSEVGRTLNLAGKRFKPKAKQRVLELTIRLQPHLPFVEFGGVK